jgi:hypothetical protein
MLALIIKGLNMTRYLLLLCFLAFLLKCNILSGKPKDHILSFCETPIDSVCMHDTCGFFNIFNKDTMLIAEGNARFVDTNFYAYWDGRDKNNNLAPCGVYIVKTTVTIKGQSKTTCGNMLLNNSNSGQNAFGRTSCDALKANCSGNYYEIPGAMRSTSTGTWVKDTGCTCCN